MSAVIRGHPITVLPLVAEHPLDHSGESVLLDNPAVLRVTEADFGPAELGRVSRVDGFDPEDDPRCLCDLEGLPESDVDVALAG
jgi:hypothetical protein